MKSGVSITAVCFLALCVGCAGEQSAPYAPVSGVVTLDGEPIPAGTVVFYPSNQEMDASMGIIQADGSYTLAAGQTGEGAWIGEHRVIVMAPEPQSYDGAPQPAQVDLPERYRSPDTSGLVFTVSEGENTINLELESE